MQRLFEENGILTNKNNFEFSSNWIKPKVSWLCAQKYPVNVYPEKNWDKEARSSEISNGSINHTLAG